MSCLKKVVALAAVAVAGLSQLIQHSHAQAQTYPSRPIRVIVGTAAGSAPDTIARLTGQWLTERLGQNVIVENRAGAGGNIATEAVVRADPDGHTLLLVTPAAAINATLYQKLNYNFMRDIAPVAAVFQAPEALMLHPGVPATTVSQLIAYAKANPGKLNMGSSGNGTGSHLAGEEFMMQAGVKFVHVPYRGGGQVVTDLIGGRIQLTFLALGLAIEHFRAGTIRVLGVSTAKRFEAMPDLPAIAEVLPGYDYGTWFGIGAPKATPAEIVTRLNREINAYLADPRTLTRLREFGGAAFPGTPQDFSRFIAEQTEKKAKVVRAAGLKVE